MIAHGSDDVLFVSQLSQEEEKSKIREAILSSDSVRTFSNNQHNNKKFNVLHNTRLLLRKYRNLRWAVEQDLLSRADTPTDNIDYIIDKLRDSIEIHDDPIAKRRIQEVIKTKTMITILENAVESLKTHPSYGDEKYTVIYITYISMDPNLMRLKTQGLFDACKMTHGQYYRRLNEAIRNLSCILWQTDGEAYALFMDICEYIEQVTS